MKKIIFNILFLVLVIASIYKLYINTINYTKPEKETLNINIPQIPVLQTLKVENPVIDDPRLWNLKPAKNINLLNKDINKSKNQCITYTAKKVGKTYILETSTDKKLNFFGIVKKKNNKYAIFYDPSRKNKKLVLIQKGEKIDQFLLLKDIKNNSIILENLSKCPEKQVLTLDILSVDIEKYKKLKEESK